MLVPFAANLGLRSVKKVLTVLKSGNEVLTSLIAPPSPRLDPQSFKLLFKALKRGDYVLISSYDFTRFFHEHQCHKGYAEKILCKDFAKKHRITRFDVSETPYLLHDDWLVQEITSYHIGREDGHHFYECRCSLRDLERELIPIEDDRYVVL